MMIDSVISSWLSLLNTMSKNHPKIHKLVFIISLSWFYALCSQVILPLPFNLVPLSLQPLPLIFCAEIFGWPAMYAYLAYLVQGVCGAPFFSRFGCGILHLLGPTGGYLWGFLLAMTFIVLTRHQGTYVRTLSIARYWLCNTIIFFCGLTQLAYFISPSKLLIIGLYPFIIGDFIIKPFAFIFAKHRNQGQQK